MEKITLGQGSTMDIQSNSLHKATTYRKNDFSDKEKIQLNSAK